MRKLHRGPYMARVSAPVLGLLHLSEARGRISLIATSSLPLNMSCLQENHLHMEARGQVSRTNLPLPSLFCLLLKEWGIRTGGQTVRNNAMHYVHRISSAAYICNIYPPKSALYVCAVQKNKYRTFGCIYIGMMFALCCCC